MPAERDPALPDRAEVRRAAERAAATYDDAAVLQREVGRRMGERLGLVKLQPAMILDAGCGTGEALVELAARYPDATIVGLDFAQTMIEAARRRSTALRASPGRLAAKILGVRSTARGAACFVCADAMHLPLNRNSTDLVWSNLMLPSIGDPTAAFAEFLRVL